MKKVNSGNDLEIKQDNVGYPGNPKVEGSGEKINLKYIVGKKPEVKDCTNQTDRPDRKCS